MTRLRSLYQKTFLVFNLLALAVLTSSCANNSDSKTASNVTYNPFEIASVYFTSMSTLQVEVAYEEGAAPNTDQVLGKGQPWTLLEQNLTALFETREIEPLIIVPKTLAEMTPIPAQNKATWNLDEIYALTHGYRKGTSNKSTGNFWIVFLKGKFFENSDNTLGIHISGTNVIAIFKDIINKAHPSPTSLTVKYLEQATLIHEMGHSLGLVNNGIPPLTDHDDPEHHGHCTNPKCIMYWGNTGSSNLARFAEKYMESMLPYGDHDMVFFGDECLQDTQQYAR